MRYYEDMTKTRGTDEFGNVQYTVRDESGQVIGRIDKTCGAWQVELPGDGGFVPVRSVKAGMDWFAQRAEILDRPKVEA